MSQDLSPILQAADLPELIQSEKIILIDATNSKNARENYAKKHLKGALFVDLNSQLADIKSDLSQGGRHPLPTIDKFSETLAELGISPASHVVVYDQTNGSNAAARFWWMLKAVGHEKVQVLTGGLEEAERQGFPVTEGIETAAKTTLYPIERWILPIADLTEVEAVSTNPSHLVIDVRDHDRYFGKTEPIDLAAGHIPGAVNVPYSGNLDEQGLFLSPEELQKKYQDIFDGKDSENIIVHCGSGVTACHTLLAIASAGFEIPKLYVGSWSEWSRNDKPIATG
jgi:thiosulfate/3-mercaptopyruvate sulfurtransferase